MNREDLDGALKKQGLPIIEKVLGRKFILFYEDEESSEIGSGSGIIAGTITGIGLCDDRDGKYVSLYINIPEVPTSITTGERITSLLGMNQSNGWIVVTEPEYKRKKPQPAGKLELLD